MKTQIKPNKTNADTYDIQLHDMTVESVPLRQLRFIGNLIEQITTIRLNEISNQAIDDMMIDYLKCGRTPGQIEGYLMRLLRDLTGGSTRALRLRVRQWKKESPQYHLFIKL